MPTISLVGTPGGDGECWVMNVDKEQFIALMGEALYKDEVDFHDDFYKDVKAEEVPPVPLRIYPDDLIKTRKRIKLTITYEEV